MHIHAFITNSIRLFCVIICRTTYIVLIPKNYFQGFRSERGNDRYEALSEVGLYQEELDYVLENDEKTEPDDYESTHGIKDKLRKYLVKEGYLEPLILH